MEYLESILMMSGILLAKVVSRTRIIALESIWICRGGDECGTHDKLCPVVCLGPRTALGQVSFGVNM